MLKESEIERIKIRLVKRKMTQKILANQLEVSESAITNVLKRKKDLPSVEEKMKQWLKEK